MCAAMKIAIASDHAAVALKTELAEWLTGLGHEVADLGTDGEASVDYPDYGYKLGEHLAAGLSERGIALCGSGIGIAIAANRNPAVRCAPSEHEAGPEAEPGEGQRSPQPIVPDHCAPPRRSDAMRRRR